VLSARLQELLSGNRQPENLDRAADSKPQECLIFNATIGPRVLAVHCPNQVAGTQGGAAVTF